MFDHHPLGLAGGAGSVNNVSQMIGAEPHLLLTGIACRTALPDRLPGIDLDQRHFIRQIPPVIFERSLGKQCQRRAVCEHIGEPVNGIGRIQRHISTTGL